MKRLAILSLLAAAPLAAREGEWPEYAGDLAATHASPLADITPETVARLKIAWTWRHGDAVNIAQRTAPGQFEATPLMIDGSLFVTTPYGNLVALDPVTGAQRWRFDTHGESLGLWRSASGFKHRGAAAWRDGKRLELFVASRTGLFAVDAATGRAIPTFGTTGRVTLTRGAGNPVGVDDPANLMISSAPIVVGDTVIVGGAIPDRLLTDPPQVGTVQAFDARTGRRRWTFAVVPPADHAPGAKSWAPGSRARTGHGNVWAPMSADAARGLVYLPTSTTTNDFYGGARLGDGLFGESLVCLDARTGRVRWHRQLVHHGVWDYDNPAAPNLVDLTVDGRRIAAVVQVTKQGFAFAFDRVTGHPVWPIAEAPVPTDTDIPGERLSPTQPVPSKPPPLVGQGIGPADANDLTPDIAAAARATIARYRSGPLFTPQTLKGTLQRPSVGGGANWGGAGFDARTQTLFVRVADAVSLSAVTEQPGTDPTLRAFWAAAAGSRSITLPGGLPLTRPPWGELVAVDLGTGTIRWRTAVGEGPATIRNHPLLKDVVLPARLGSPNEKSGPLLAGGLVFLTGADSHLYAFDQRDGRELWRGVLPHAQGATPMTYRGADGRQYLVVASGSGPGATLVAFTLDPGAP